MKPEDLLGHRGLGEKNELRMGGYDKCTSTSLQSWHYKKNLEMTRWVILHTYTMHFFPLFTLMSWHKWHSHRDPNSFIYHLVIEKDTQKSLNCVDMIKKIWLMNSSFYVFARECIHSHWWPRVLVANKASSDGPWRAKFVFVEPLTFIYLFSMHHFLHTTATTNKSLLNVSPHHALLHKSHFSTTKSQDISDQNVACFLWSPQQLRATVRL